MSKICIKAKFLIFWWPILCLAACARVLCMSQFFLVVEHLSFVGNGKVISNNFVLLICCNNVLFHFHTQQDSKKKKKIQGQRGLYNFNGVICFRPL